MRTRWARVAAWALVSGMVGCGSGGRGAATGTTSSSAATGATSSGGTGGEASTSASGAGTGGATSGGTGGGSGTDGGALTPCPTSGAGSVVAAGVTCLKVTPAQTGADPTGENATVPSYALAPGSGANGKLVLFFNGSGGHPGDSIASPTNNFYTAATSLGYAVLGVSYRSNTEVGVLCVGDDACFFPTRESLITGAFQTGASATLQGIEPTEGIAPRVGLALEWLAQHDASHGWDAFLTGPSTAPPGSRIAWSKVVVSGHSQGGGHAAACGKLFAVERVIQLSSTCDEVSGVPATWLDQSNGPWATSPNGFYGLDVTTTFTGGMPTGGDITCFTHAAAWQALGMTAANSDDACVTCGTATDQHGDSLTCAGNYPNWVAMLM
jgi:hypothetical protein